LQPVAHLPVAASDRVELVGPAASPPAGRCAGASGVFATVGLQLERVRAARPRGTRVAVWFQDEARIGQKNSLTRVWGQTGTRPVAPKDLGFASAYLFGAVCPSQGTAAALIMPICNTAAMNHHLSEISSQVAADAHAVVILDGAGWHRSQGLVGPANITLLELPPYSPELNPVERIWHYLRSHWLANSVFASLADIMDACEMAWNRFATNHALNHGRVRSLCAVAWAPAAPALELVPAIKLRLSIDPHSSPETSGDPY
jgi:transposase